VLKLTDKIRGRVWKFGDSVDTNQLAGGGVRVSDNQNDNLKANCLRGLRPEFNEQVQPGDILIAGTNFGCGSSRQTAVLALQVCGVAAVMAESVARIHMRNSIAAALPTLVTPGVSDFADDGDLVEIDYAGGLARNITQEREIELRRFPQTVERIYELGGISNVILQRLAAQGIRPPQPA
jgi:3-isopropylmalate/(R)-2-methylmalate dehydratase small subunit